MHANSNVTTHLHTKCSLSVQDTWPCHAIMATHSAPKPTTLTPLTTLTPDLSCKHLSRLLGLKLGEGLGNNSTTFHAKFQVQAMHQQHRTGGAGRAKGYVLGMAGAVLGHLEQDGSSDPKTMSGNANRYGKIPGQPDPSDQNPNP
jgi:hypothetical protein